MSEPYRDPYMDQIRAVIQVCEDTDGILIVDRDGIIRDHRIAMMAAVSAAFAQKPVTLLGAECVHKSYPQFWLHFQMLGGKIHGLILR